MLTFGYKKSFSRKQPHPVSPNMNKELPPYNRIPNPNPNSQYKDYKVIIYFSHKTMLFPKINKYEAIPFFIHKKILIPISQSYFPIIRYEAIIIFTHKTILTPNLTTYINIEMHHNLHLYSQHQTSFG